MDSRPLMRASVVLLSSPSRIPANWGRIGMVICIVHGNLSITIPLLLSFCLTLIFDFSRFISKFVSRSSPDHLSKLLSGDAENTQLAGERGNLQVEAFSGPLGSKVSLLPPPVRRFHGPCLV